MFLLLTGNMDRHVLHASLPQSSKLVTKRRTELTLTAKEQLYPRDMSQLLITHP